MFRKDSFAEKSLGEVSFCFSRAFLIVAPSVFFFFFLTFKKRRIDATIYIHIYKGSFLVFFIQREREIRLQRSISFFDPTANCSISFLFCKVCREI